MSKQNWERIKHILKEDNFPKGYKGAAVPFIDKIKDNILKVYFSSRDKNNRSYIFWATFNIVDNFSLLDMSTKPEFNLGNIGEFDENGSMGCQIFYKNNEKYLYYIGWNLGVSIPFRNSIGAVKWDNKLNRFKKIYRGPLLDRSIYDPCFIASHHIIKIGNKYLMYYLSCDEWINIKDKLTHKYNIKIATSSDGIKWDPTGKIAIDFKSSYEYAISVPRVIFEDGIYKVNNTKITFSKAEILKEVDNNPKAFSPNVIMRPLYQEVILPNLCYLGGGGEMAYWLELKNYFDEVQIPFPILLLRNSVQVVSEKQVNKLGKLNISLEELFLKQYDLLSKKVIENSEIKVNFDAKIQFLEKQFLELKEIAQKTDVSFVNAVNAQERKQLKGLQNLQKRLLKAEKKRQKDVVDRITQLQNEILPNQSLEERQRNFSEYYLAYGSSFIKALKGALKPLQLEFTVLEL